MVCLDQLRCEKCQLQQQQQQQQKPENELTCATCQSIDVKCFSDLTKREKKSLTKMMRNSRQYAGRYKGKDLLFEKCVDCGTLVFFSYDHQCSSCLSFSTVRHISFTRIHDIVINYCCI